MAAGGSHPERFSVSMAILRGGSLWASSDIDYFSSHLASALAAWQMID